MDHNSPHHKPNSFPRQEPGQLQNVRTLSEFGALMRSRREEKGLSLPEISSITKIQTRYLVFFEEGKTEKLPKGVYRSGYLRSYLSALSENPTPWLRRFTELSRHRSVRDWMTALGPSLPRRYFRRLLEVLHNDKSEQRQHE